MDTDSLKASLEALPKELYDEIFDLTFTPSSIDLPVLGSYDVNIGEMWQSDFTPTSVDRIIHATYKPPKLLQISREIRERYARRYYGNGSIFYVAIKILSSALASIPLKHAALIEEIRSLASDPNRGKETSMTLRCQTAAQQLTCCFCLLPVGWYSLRMRKEIFKYSILSANGTMKWVSYYDLRDLLEVS